MLTVKEALENPEINEYEALLESVGYGGFRLAVNALVSKYDNIPEDILISYIKHVLSVKYICCAFIEKFYLKKGIFKTNNVGEDLLGYDKYISIYDTKFRFGAFDVYLHACPLSGFMAIKGFELDAPEASAYLSNTASLNSLQKPAIVFTIKEFGPDKINEYLSQF